MLNNEYYLWSAGLFGARIISFMKNDIKFKAVIDNNIKKQGTMFHGIPVVSYEDVKMKLSKAKIVISKVYPAEIQAFLDNEGYIKDQNYFLINDFIPEYYWNKNESIVFRAVDFAVTTFCNRQCDGCAVFIPYAKKHKHMSVDQLHHDLNLLFSYVDSVMQLNITVGESTLNKDLPQICNLIYDQYRGRYQELIVQTNATVIPEDADMQNYKNAKTIFALSNYPEHKELTNKFIKQCDNYNVKWYLNPQGGNRETWIDYGDPRIINERDPAKLRERYSKCLKPGVGLHDGRIYICMVQAYSHLVAEEGETNKDDAFDINQPVTEKSRKELYETVIRKSPVKGYLSQCMRCNGTLKFLKEKHPNDK